jgi:hypothetical protein
LVGLGGYDGWFGCMGCLLRKISKHFELVSAQNTDSFSQYIPIRRKIQEELPVFKPFF